MMDPLLYNNVYYFVRDMLWIIPAKNASSSIKVVLNPGSYISREEALELNRYFTVGVIRHPLDRVVSALYSVCQEPAPFAERLAKYIHNSHVRPQAPAFEGLRLDFILHVERLNDEWKVLQALKELPELPHINVGQHRPKDWRGECDWAAFLPLYERDFALCSDYQRP